MILLFFCGGVGGVVWPEYLNIIKMSFGFRGLTTSVLKSVSCMFVSTLLMVRM
jgi:hypothetical protein